MDVSGQQMQLTVGRQLLLHTVFQRLRLTLALPPSMHVFQGYRVTIICLQPQEENMEEPGGFYGMNLHMAHFTFTHIPWLTLNCKEGGTQKVLQLGRKEEQILVDSWNYFHSKSNRYSDFYFTVKDSEILVKRIPWENTGYQ